MAQAAVALHHGYGAIESAMTRIARDFEGSVLEGADWYQRLLESMAMDLEGIRPAVLSTESVGHLTQLLAFRHFFRHAYGIDLDPDRLRALRSTALELEDPLSRDLDRFDELLRKASAAD